MSTDAFTPPVAEHDAAIDLEAEPPRPGVMVYLAAGSSTVAAFVGFVLSFQMFLLYYWFSGPNILSMIMLVLTAVWVLCGALLAKGNGWAAIGCTALAILCTVVAPIWMVWAMLTGVFTLLSIIWAPFCLLAAALAPLSIGPARKISAHRRALYT